jgi:hypothetical protein
VFKTVSIRPFQVLPQRVRKPSQRHYQLLRRLQGAIPVLAIHGLEKLLVSELRSSLQSGLPGRTNLVIDLGIGDLSTLSRLPFSGFTGIDMEHLDLSHGQ